jgi:hypothetical protein
MRRDEPAKKILRYFLRNQEAADTYEGIVRWRLREESIHQTTEETQHALAWLVASGFLCELRISRGPPLFRLNQAKRAEAREFLEEAAELGGQ